MTLSEQIKKVETEEKDNTEKIAECLKLLENTKDNLPEKPTQDDLFEIWQGFFQARNSLIKMRAFGTEEMSKYYDMLDEVRDWLHYSEAFEELKIIIKFDSEQRAGEADTLLKQIKDDIYKNMDENLDYGKNIDKTIDTLSNFYTGTINKEIEINKEQSQKDR